MINRLTAEDLNPDTNRGVVRGVPGINQKLDADEKRTFEDVEVPVPNIADILKANDDHLRAIHRSTGRNDEWDIILKDWLLLYGWADAARKREAKRHWGDSWDYIWSAVASVGALLGIYILLWSAIWLNGLISGGTVNFWSSIVVAILVGVPLGLMTEWLRRRSNK